MTKQADYKRVGECLYLSSHGIYYSIVKTNGKQIKKSLRTSDRKLAERRCREFRNKAQRLSGPERQIQFEDLAKRWLESIRPNLKPMSYQRRQVGLNQLLPYFKGQLVRSIGQQEIEAWRMVRCSQIANRTFNIELGCLRGLFDYAVKDMRILLDNPAQEVTRLKQPKTMAKIPSRVQFQQLLAKLREKPHQVAAADFLEFLAYSGMRLAEAQEVRLEDIDFEQEIVTITGGEEGTKNSEQRTIPLFPSLKAFLDRYLQTRVYLSTSDRLFPKLNVLHMLKKVCAGLQFPNFGHHSMRHFFCSNAIECGIDFKVIAEWLGHKDGGILVAQTYGHLRNEHSRAMALKMTYEAGIATAGGTATSPDFPKS